MIESRVQAEPLSTNRGLKRFCSRAAGEGIVMSGLVVFQDMTT